MSGTDCDRAENGLSPVGADGGAEKGGAKDPGVPLSRPAGLLVAVAAAVCVTVALVHMCLVFLYVAPSNIVSQRYEQQIDAWVYPYFEQNWQLFAPNPESAPQAVSARAATTPGKGGRRVGAWLDLTAADAAAVRHSPFPSHTAQNMLRRAWIAYSEAQGTGDQEDSDRARMLRRYLLDIAVQRLAAHGRHDFDAVQLRVVTVPVPPRTRPAGTFPPPRSFNTRYLPWWQVTPHDH